MDVRKHRESAATTDPAELADKVASIAQRLEHNRKHRYELLVAPISIAEAFARAEQETENDRDRRA